MTELVRVHIDKAVALLEALEPAGDAVGIERGAVIADEHVRRVLPAVAHRIAQLLVPCPIRAQHLHRLQRQLHIQEEIRIYEKQVEFSKVYRSRVRLVHLR